MQKKLIQKFYDENQEFITSPFTYSGTLNKRGKDLFKRIVLKDKKVLEVGCGHGHVLGYCSSKGAKCYGIDISKQAIEIARKNYPKIQFIVDDIENLKNKRIKNSKFDIVIILEVIEHTLDPKKTLEIIHHKLKKGGYLILSCPNYANTCGIVKKIAEIFMGKNTWAPFAEWKKEANEQFITYSRIKRYIQNKFKIEKMETIDIFRGIFPFAYTTHKIEKNKINSYLRRTFERSRNKFPFKFLGSNIIIRARK